jgi:predicted transposase/invertase (TIGR01784 family)
MKTNNKFKAGGHNSPPKIDASLKDSVQLSADDNPIDICKDNIFKAVFTKSTPESRGALSKLVSALIGHNVSILTIAANEPPVNNVWGRHIRFDISCRAENGELVNIEMCLNPDRFETMRLEYYSAELFTSQDIKGTDRGYNDLKKSYQIAILAKRRYFPDEVILHSFEYYDPVHNISLNGKNRIITLELSKLKQIADKPTTEMSAAELWGSYFRYLTVKAKRVKINEIIAQEEGIAMASKVVMTISRDDAERARLESEYKYEVDLQSKVVYSERMVIRKGERRGIRKGERKGELKIIDLLKSGKSPEEIIRDYER